MMVSKQNERLLKRQKVSANLARTHFLGCHHLHLHFGHLQDNKGKYSYYSINRYIPGYGIRAPPRFTPHFFSKTKNTHLFFFSTIRTESTANICIWYNATRYLSSLQKHVTDRYESSTRHEYIISIASHRRR